MRSRLPLLLLACTISAANAMPNWQSQDVNTKQDFHDRAPEARKKLAQPGSPTRAGFARVGVEVEPSEREGVGLGRHEKRTSPGGAAQKTKRVENQPGISTQLSQNASDVLLKEFLSNFDLSIAAREAD